MDSFILLEDERKRAADAKQGSLAAVKVGTETELSAEQALEAAKRAAAGMTALQALEAVRKCSVPLCHVGNDPITQVYLDRALEMITKIKAELDNARQLALEMSQRIEQLKKENATLTRAHIRSSTEGPYDHLPPHSTRR